MKVGLRQHKRPKRNMIPSLCGFDRKESLNCQFLPFTSKIRPVSPIIKLLNLDLNIYKVNKSYRIPFFTRMPDDVKNLTTSVNELLGN